jgi:hypothetical protein
MMSKRRCAECGFYGLTVLHLSGTPIGRGHRSRPASAGGE